MTKGKELKDDLFELCDSQPLSEVVSKFQQRIKEEKFTIQENPESHFCVYFAAYDLGSKEVFIGHHKKSGLWLFNGVHIDEGEIMKETLGREIDEEWGLKISDFEINNPSLFTITEINNPSKQTCKRHYDIWYFINVEKNKFQPDQVKILEEFHQIGWKSYDEARKLVKDKNTLVGIEFVAKNYFKEDV